MSWLQQQVPWRLSRLLAVIARSSSRLFAIFPRVPPSDTTRNTIKNLSASFSFNLWQDGTSCFISLLHRMSFYVRHLFLINRTPCTLSQRITFRATSINVIRWLTRLMSYSFGDRFAQSFCTLWMRLNEFEVFIVLFKAQCYYFIARLWSIHGFSAAKTNRWCLRICILHNKMSL